jgi:hypothetical protein
VGRTATRIAMELAMESAISQVQEDTSACANGALPGVPPGEHSCSWELDWLNRLQRA